MLAFNGLVFIIGFIMALGFTVCRWLFG